MPIFYDLRKNRQFEDKKLSNLREKVLQRDSREVILNYEGVH